MTPDAALRILDVEDQAPPRYARSKTLREAGVEVLEAADGREALDVVAGVRPTWSCSTCTGPISTAPGGAGGSWTIPPPRWSRCGTWRPRLAGAALTSAGRELTGPGGPRESPGRP
jgi:hypothetical protein